MASTNSTLVLDQPVARISQTALIVSIWVLVALASIFLIVRISTSIYVVRRMQIADGFAILALAILAANGAVMTAMAPPMYELLSVSVGKEQATPAFLNRASLYLKLQFASTVLFWSCLWSVKASFLSFFRKLTEHLLWPRRAWWAITIFTGLAFVTSVITYPVSCTSFTLGACQNPDAIYKSLVSLRYSTAVDIITDLCIIALPIAIVAPVQISTLQKLGLITVLGLGIFVVGFAVVRIIVTDTSNVHPEISWLALWSAIEASVAVIICSLASFKTLFTARRQGSSRQQYYNTESRNTKSKGISSPNRRRISAGGPSHTKSIPLTSVRSTKNGVAKEAWMDDASSEQEILRETIHGRI